MCEPSASQRKRFETGSGQQSTEWLQRVDWNTIEPSGSQHGSMSLHGIGKSVAAAQERGPPVWGAAILTASQERGPPGMSDARTSPSKVSCFRACVSRSSVKRW